MFALYIPFQNTRDFIILNYRTYNFMLINNFNLDSIYRKEEYLRIILTKRTTVFKATETASNHATRGKT